MKVHYYYIQCKQVFHIQLLISAYTVRITYMCHTVSLHTDGVLVSVGIVVTLCSISFLIYYYTCSPGSHKMKASDHSICVVPATAVEILLTLAQYISSTPC